MSYPEARQQIRAPQRRAAFSEGEYRHRLDRIRASMQANGIDLLFLSAPESICYVSGYAADWYGHEARATGAQRAASRSAPMPMTTSMSTKVMRKSSCRSRRSRGMYASTSTP